MISIKTMRFVDLRDAIPVLDFNIFYVTDEIYILGGELTIDTFEVIIELDHELTQPELNAILKAGVTLRDNVEKQQYILRNVYKMKYNKQQAQLAIKCVHVQPQGI